MKRTRGSILLATMIVAVIVAALCGSYLYMVSSEHRLSNRAFQFNAATNLAEAGVEEALWALNKKTLKASEGWAINGTDAYRTFNAPGSAVNLGGAYTGELRVRVDAFASAAPIITSEGRVMHPTVRSVIKQVRVTIKATNSTMQGFIVRDNIIFNGKAVVDSYNSAKGHYNPNTNRNDLVSVVAINGNINTNDAQIWGRVGVGSASTSAVGTPMNGGYIKNSSTVGNTTYDTKAVTTGVKMDWPAAPVSPVIGTTGGTVLSVTTGTTVTLGSPSSSTPQYYYYTDNGGTLSLSGATVLKVVGPVVLVIQRGLRMADTAKIQIDSSAKAKIDIYVSENVNITGTNVLNDQPEASRLTIHAAGGGGQNIALGTSATLTGTFNGPTWNVNLNGNASWRGALLAAYANISNTVGIHYDEALGGAGSNIQVMSWQILKEPANSGTPYARDTRTPF